MMNGQNEHSNKHIEDAIKAFKDSVNKLPTKDASNLNAFMQDLEAVGFNEDLSVDEKRDQIELLGKTINREYGIKSNK